MVAAIKLLPSIANGSGDSHWVVPIPSTHVSIQVPLSAVPGSTDEQDSLILRVAVVKPSELSSISSKVLEDNSSDLKASAADAIILRAIAGASAPYRSTELPPQSYEMNSRRQSDSSSSECASG